MNEQQLAVAHLLVSRLERLSADSFWAHQACGIRGSLLRVIDLVEPGCECDVYIAKLEDLLNRGFYILEKAALEYYRQK